MSSNEHPQQPGEPTQPLPQGGGSSAGGPPQPPSPQPPQPYPGQPQGYPNAPLPPYAGPGQSYPGQVPQQQPYPGPQPYPGQPYPGQVPPPGYPGQPGTPAPWQGSSQPYGGPAQPGPVPPYGPPPTEGKNRAPLIIGVGVGVLVLGLILIFTIGRSLVPVATPTATVGPGGTSTPIPPAPDAAAAVRGYLEAVAAGDAVTALSYAATPPADVSLLTNEVLGAALLATPLGDIEVGTPSGTSAAETIEASYTLGDRAVATSFEVVKSGSLWRLQEVAATVGVATLVTGGVPVTVNGSQVASETLTLFPGSYILGTGDPRYTIEPATFVVQSPDDRPDTYSAQLGLSTEGVAEIRSAAQRKLSACLKKKALKPSGCNFGVRLAGGYTLRKSTVKWTITKGRTVMRKLKPSISPAEPASATAAATVQLKCTFRTTNGYSWYGYASIYAVTGELTDAGVRVRFN